MQRLSQLLPGGQKALGGQFGSWDWGTPLPGLGKRSHPHPSVVLQGAGLGAGDPGLPARVADWGILRVPGPTPHLEKMAPFLPDRKPFKSFLIPAFLRPLPTEKENIPSLYTYCFQRFVYLFSAVLGSRSATTTSSSCGKQARLWWPCRGSSLAAASLAAGL